MTALGDLTIRPDKMSKVSSSKTRFIQQPRRDELASMRDLKFADGNDVVVARADKAFPYVSLKDGSHGREYTWAMVDLLARSGIAFPIDRDETNG